MRKHRKPIYYFILLILCIILLFFVSLSLGSVRIPLGEVWSILFGKGSENSRWETIVLLFRLPRVLTALFAGAALSLSGLQMQTFFRNPLAGPSILGIGSGASLGVALVVLTASRGNISRFLDGLGLYGDIGITVAASIGSVAVLALILLISRRVKSIITILILGMLIGYGTNALVSIIIHFSVAERVHAYINWTFGSFGQTTWKQMRVFIPVLIAGIGLSQFGRKPMNAMLLGETYSESMGLRLSRIRLYMLCTTGLLTGTVTAFCGPIAFLGVAMPHLCRSLFGTSDHKTLLPAAALMGGIIAMVADLIAQLPGSDIVLPLNAVTALIGTPVIALIIIRRRNLQETV